MQRDIKDGDDHVKDIRLEEFEQLLREHQKQIEQGDTSPLDLKEIRVTAFDLSGYNLSYINGSLSEFRNCKFDASILQHCVFQNTLFWECSFHGADLSDSELQGAAMRDNDLSEANISGCNMYAAILECANLEGIISNEETKWFHMHCPETGPMLGYKKCFNERLVQLLIPADAKRTSATMASCRCSKAKVLTIKSFDYTQSYEEAWSLVDENFVYRVGEWIEVKDFNEDRWFDSTTGIHFWLTREEALAY